MREKLKEINGVRSTFKGTFSRLGKKTRYKAKRVGDQWVTFDVTVLLVNVCNREGVQVCDHLWLNYTKGFEALGELKEGDVITFDGRVKPYLKGYVSNRDEDFQEVDFKLSHPTKVNRVMRGQGSLLGCLDCLDSSPVQ